MKYRIAYDIETGDIFNVEEIRTAFIDVDESDLVKRCSTGDAKGKVVNGQVIEDTTETRIEENVVPSKEIADALGIPDNVGIPKDVLSEMVMNAGLEL